MTPNRVVTASFTAAVLLGFAPLVAGVAIFVAWVLSRADWLVMAGYVTIHAGGWAVLVGAACLAIYAHSSWKSGLVPRRRIVRRALVVLGLFLANFVAAGACVAGAFLIQSRYTVSVTNHSDLPLQAVRIHGGDVDVTLDAIAPGATIKRGFWINQDGSLVLTGIHGTQPLDITIDTYVTGNLGGNKLVLLKPDGTASVTDLRPGTSD